MIDDSASTSSPTKRKKPSLAKKLEKLMKQQEHLDEKKQYLPGKLEIVSSQSVKPKIVNFFGDVHTEVFSLHSSFDDQYLAVGCSNGDVKIYSIFQGKILMMGNTSRLSGYPNTGIRWRPKSNREFTACNCDGTIKWYDREKETTVGHYETEAGYLCVDYNSEGDWSAFGNSEHEIHIFDEGTKKFQQKYLAGTLDCVYPNHTNRIFCVKGLKSDRNLFFTGGWDDTVRLWDVRVPKIYIRKFVGPTVTADSLDLQGSTLLAGNYAIKNNLQLWDFSSGELIENLDVKQTKQESNSYCFAASFAHKSKHNLLAAGFSGMNKVKIFKDNQVAAELCLQAAPLCLCFYQMGEKDFIAVSGAEGTIYQVKINIE